MASMTPPSDWFADEAFWEWSFPHMFPADRFEKASAEVDQLTRLAGIEGGRALDVACGPGRHAVELARRGFDVTGVDRSAFLLDHARRRAASKGVEVAWVEEDMRRFRRPDSYDLALCLYTSFGFFERPEDNQSVLENLQVCLRPGGRCVVDVLGKEILARVFSPSEVKQLDGGGLLVQRRTVLDDWDRVETEWLEVRDTVVRRFGFRLWLYSGEVLRSRMQEAGFGSVTLHGSFDGAPYNVEATRLVAVGTKPWDEAAVVR